MEKKQVYFTFIQIYKKKVLLIKKQRTDTKGSVIINKFNKISA